ncbi:N-acyl-D-amino-acid deacylase family protein [Steroidobacter sp.]|uniref:N-acyl-D-amino-acid deacylase family protein n=1 Tax=Steroidobacter sp. TaxID=1978227 RepID=UPI001A55E421|nr:D-aminoacylase [Steroidobacter sp.]MBL8270223.1 D-aminoacylase [Steroidobacter sp.]
MFPMHKVCAFLVAALLAVLPEALTAESFLIQNARLVDGTGAPAIPRASVRIQDERIVAVGALQALPGERVVDAKGLVLSPGFIDTHSHHDRGMSKHRDMLPAVTQGVTTLILGQDGGHTPLPELSATLSKEPVAVNIASYLGHGTIRNAVLGKDFRRTATADEVQRMRGLVREGMQAGALGLSTGLEYDPGIYASKDEVLALASEAASFGGRYISHMRSEDREVWQALDEIVEIGRRTGMPVQVSHMKLAMTDWWGQADRFIGVLDRARASGVKITGDVYPYEYWNSWLSVLFPNRDFDNRETVRFVLRSLAPPEGLRINGYGPDPSAQGMTVAEIAKARNMDPVEVVVMLLTDAQKTNSEVSVIGTSMRSDDVAKFIAWPHSNICSDGNVGGKHPRGAGSFTRVLRVYVREQKLLTLEQAIHKMSGLAAEHMGITDRGVIRPGAYADLVLLDPQTVADRATLEQPGLSSIGIDKVWVNGVAVVEQGGATGAYPGKALRRER